MSHEKIGAIHVHPSGKGYWRVQRGITLPYDNMTKKEREKLNGEVTVYRINVDGKDEST